MALARKEVLVVDAKGNVQPGASVTVRREVAGQPLEPLYSDRDGLVLIDNPVTADSAGVAAFHCLGGAFQIGATLGAFSRTQRYVPIGTAGETDAGVVFASGGTGWLFDDATADADPGSGLFRLNHATPASATEIYIDNESAGGADVSAWLDSLDDGGGSTMRGHLQICDPDQPTQVFHIYAVSGSVVGEGSPDAGYRTLTVAHVAGQGALAAGALYAFDFAAKGDEGSGGGGGGDVVGPDEAVDGQLALFSGETGKAIAGAVLGSPPEALTLAGLLALIPSGGGGGGFTQVNIQAFTASGTYTPTSGMAWCIVVSTGGGAGGGGADVNNPNISFGVGSGGGAGGTCIEIFNAATIGASQAVAIGPGGTAGGNTGTSGGAGGNTTFGALHTATGGGVGIGSGTSQDPTDHNLGGAGGVPTGGLLNITGGDGGSGSGFLLTVEAVIRISGVGGHGGASFWGGGGRAGAESSATNSAGSAGVAYGSGGGGATATLTAGAAGAVGADGICVVIEFIV